MYRQTEKAAVSAVFDQAQTKKRMFDISFMVAEQCCIKLSGNYEGDTCQGHICQGQDQKNTNSNTHPFSFTHTLSRAPPTEGLFVPQSVAPQQQRPLPHFPLYQDRVHPPPKRVCLMNAPIKKRPERQRQARCVCVCLCTRVCAYTSARSVQGVKEKAAGLKEIRGVRF